VQVEERLGDAVSHLVEPAPSRFPMPLDQIADASLWLCSAIVRNLDLDALDFGLGFRSLDDR
jgi:hypothetical protein